MVAFALTCFLNAYSQPFSLIVIVAQVVYGCLAWKWRLADGSWRKFFALKSVLAPKPIAFFLSFGVAVYLLNPRPWNRFILNLQGSGKPLGIALDGAFLRDLVTWLGAGPGLAIPVCLLFFSLGMVATWVFHRELLVLVVTTFLTTAAALQLLIWMDPGHGFFIRYVIFLLPFSVLLVALGVDLVAKGAGVLLRKAGGLRPAGRADGLTTALSLVLAAIVFAPLVYSPLKHYYAAHTANYKKAIAYVAERARPGDVITIPPFRRRGDRGGLKWYYKRNEELSDASTFVVLQSLDDAKGLLESHEQFWFIDMEPVHLNGYSVDISELKTWVKESFTEEVRLPHCTMSPRLGPPEQRDELVIYRAVPAR